MTGEGSADPHWNELRAIQPGGRAPAPGELALVQSFINSHYDLEVEHGRDLFATPAALASWIACHDPLAGSAVEAQLTDEDLRRALAVREGLRGLASSNGGAGQTHGDRADSALAAGLERLNEAARGAAVELRLTQSQPRFVPVASRPLDRVLAAVLAAAATAIIDGRWARGGSRGGRASRRSAPWRRRCCCRCSPGATRPRCSGTPRPSASGSTI